MRSPLLPLIVLPLLATGLHAQSGARTIGVPAATSRARIDSLFRFVSPGAPGCGVGVYTRGALTWSKGYGLASLEHRVPITANTIFDIGSTSKQFTAALTLILVADGKLTLDTPVRRVVGELPAWGDTVTVRHLLHHTSGVRDYLTLFRLAGIRSTDYSTQQEAVALVARQRELDFAPGTAYSYSNSGYLLLAEIVTRLSGKPLAQVAQERLFAPLRMTSTRFLDQYDAVIPRRAWGYAPVEKGFAVSMSNFEQVGDGAVQTSLQDLAAWVHNFEQPTVGGAALVRELERTDRIQGAPHMYARGLMVDSVRGLRRVRHGGSWAGFNAELARIPDRQLGVAVLCNREDADPVAYADGIVGILLDEARVTAARGPSPQPASAPAPSLPVTSARAYAGSFMSDIRVIQVLDSGTNLTLATGDERYRLNQTAPGAFEIVGPSRRPPVTFVGTPESGITDVEIINNGMVERYTRFDAARRQTAAEREMLVGAWYSAELDATWHITTDSTGAIYVTIPRRSPERAGQVGASTLTLRLGMLHVERKAIPEFTVATGRARGIRFQRRSRD